MKTTIHCPNCDASFSVPESALGRMASCPHCQQRFEVRAPTPIVPAPKTTPDAASADERAFPGIQTEDAGPRVRKPTSRAGPAATDSQQSTNAVPWLIAGVSCLAAGIAVWFVLFSGGGGGASHAHANRGELVLYLGEAANESLSLQLDGADHPLRGEATQRVPLAPGEHQLRLRRRGFEPIEQSVSIGAGSSISITPSWKRLGTASVSASNQASLSGAVPSAASWVQNVEVAQRQARQAGEHVLVLFLGSDWSAPSRELMSNTLAAASVGAALNERFQLAVLDYPITPGAQIDDFAHNKWMLEKYGVNPEEFPTLLAMDATGLPFAEAEAETNPAALAAQINSLHQLKSEYDTTLGDVDDLDQALSAIQWLDNHHVLRHHQSHVLRWYQLARRQDPQNEQGNLGPFFEAMWQVEMAQGLRDKDASKLQRLLDVLDQWRQQQQFKDANRGARLHLLGCFAAFQLEDLARARQLAADGSQFETTDRDLAQKLLEIPKALDEAGQLGSGSGFVVAPNYVLTNYHVVEGPGAIKLGLSDGSPAAIDARVAAVDREKDLALLVTGQTIGAPLSVARDAPGRGAQVAGFGFPLGGAVGDGLKLTTGVISGLPSADTDGMLLLDMRVNPGNSGGPLCSADGAVVGVVTARTLADAEVDSYGMAIPAPTIDAFLKRNVPRYSPAAVPTINGGWDQVDAAVNRSILRVVKVR